MSHNLPYSGVHVNLLGRTYSAPLVHVDISDKVYLKQTQWCPRKPTSVLHDRIVASLTNISQSVCVQATISNSLFGHTNTNITTFGPNRSPFHHHNSQILLISLQLPSLLTKPPPLLPAARILRLITPSSLLHTPRPPPPPHPLLHGPFNQSQNP